MLKADTSGFKLNTENIMKTLKCTSQSPLYTRLRGEINKISEKITLIPEIYYKFINDFKGQKAVFVIITAGKEICQYSRECFDEGEALAGLVSDTIADELVFDGDRLLSDILRESFAKMNMGVKKRLEAPNDIPIEYNKTILEAMSGCEIGITSGFMYDPPKTMSYILTLTDDKEIFNAQHDCSKCPNVNCPRRSVQAKKMESVSFHGEVKLQDNSDDVLCVDIGTTTLAFERVYRGINNVYTAVNKQRRFGADVISRIEAANRGTLKELQSIIKYQLTEGISKLYKGNDIPEKIVISANTTMIQLLMGYSCERMGKYPFEPENKGYIETVFSYRANNIPMHIIPAVSAFVGGDIVSGMYMCDFDKSEKVNVFIDLGTNGEMAVGNRDKIIVSSTAVGPAFEGGRISCGTGSVDGAVCGIDLKSKRIKTINDKPPVGLCGTGIVELISEMLSEKIIDNTGLLTEKYFSKGYPVNDNIYFTQKDIREIQTAKAAVRAGVEILIKNYGCKYEDIENVFIAGGFGYRLNIKKACNIGLIPPFLEGKCKAVGNSSLGGAVKLAFNMFERKRLDNICSISDEFPLALDNDFNEMYIKYMNF